MSDPGKARNRQAKMSPVPVEGLTCPNCGGTLEAHLGLRVIRVRFCQTRLLVVSQDRLPPACGRAEAKRTEAHRSCSALADEVDGIGIDAGGDAEFGEALLCFLPFYRVEADCIGIALGTEQRTRTVGSGKRRTNRNL